MIWVLAAVWSAGLALLMHRAVVRAAAMSPEEVRTRAGARGMTERDVERARTNVGRLRIGRWIMAANALLATGLAVAELTL